MHHAYIGENNIKCVVHDDLGGRTEQLNIINCRFSTASLALRVIFSVSQLWNIFSSFTEPLNYPDSAVPRGSPLLWSDL